MEIDGLNGSKEFIRLDFNNDLNIITGRNGAGKTTILKLIWYIVSGNISFAIREINFRKIKLQTTDYSCIISRTTRNNCSLYLKVNEQDPIEIDDWVIDEEDADEALEFLVTQLKNIADKKDI
ncbi:AAA family ATPase, partial [Xanthomonas citri pv. citri]